MVSRTVYHLLLKSSQVVVAKVVAARNARAKGVTLRAQPAESVPSIAAASFQLSVFYRIIA
jgi:hypothetical protein